MNALTRIEPVSTPALIPFDDVARMGQVMAQSKLFGIQSEQQAIALMLLCQSENLHPATAMRDYHLIQGRPALKADAMLARFQSAGGKVRWTAYTDARVEAVFTHPAGDTITIEWTPERVARAGIKNDMHGKYPRQMLKARCISEGIRAIYPGVLSGMYAPEEIQDAGESGPAPALEAPAGPEKLSRAEALKRQIRATPITAENSRNVSTLHAALAGGEVLDAETGEVTPAPDAGLILLLEAAATRAELEHHRPAVAALKGDAKRQAVAAWKAAEARLTESEPAAPVAA